MPSMEHRGLPIRRARPEEADRLTALAFAAKGHWGYPDHWLEAWRDDLTFTPAFVAAHPVYVAVDEEDAPVACYALLPSGGSGEVELEHFWVHPDAMGRGLGRRLFEHAAGVARSLGGDALLIDSDPYAEDFYRRMGAERVGEVRADMDGQRRELPRLRYALAVNGGAK